MMTDIMVIAIIIPALISYLRYGDKTPKSFLARLLTVLWMITGTIVASLFTANVTTVLTTKNVAALQNVLGQKVI